MCDRLKTCHTSKGDVRFYQRQAQLRGGIRMYLSVRIKSSKQIKGQAAHDFLNRPGYANLDKTKLNKVVLGGSQEEVFSKIDSQAKWIKETYNKNVSDRRALASTAEERRRIGRWRKTTSTHKTMIITFCSEFRSKQDTIDKDELDRCAKSFLNDFCEKNNCSPTYLVRHEDETTTHYHATYTNFNEKTFKTNRFEIKDLGELQDLAGKHFEKMGIARGKKKQERLDIARQNNPQLEDESKEEYNKRIYKLANVVNKSVSQLHEDLPKEKAILEEELNQIKAELNDKKQRHSKMLNYIQKAENKLTKTDTKEVEIRNKINRNIATYENRKINYESDIESLESQLSSLSYSLDEKTEVKSSLEKNIEELNAESDKKKKEIRKLRSSPIEKDIGRNYEVITSRNFGIPKIETMYLVEPNKLNKASRHLSEKIKLNRYIRLQLDSVKKELNAKEKELNAKESELEKCSKELESDRANFDNAVKKGIDERFKELADTIKNTLIKMGKEFISKGGLFSKAASYRQQAAVSDEQINEFNKMLGSKVEEVVNNETRYPYQSDDNGYSI